MDPAKTLIDARAQFSFFDENVTSEEIADRFAKALAPFATDDFVCVMDGGALTTTYEGIEGLRAGWLDFLSAFDSIEITPGEYRVGPSGDCVVEFVHLRGKPTGVAADIDQEAGAVWRVREDGLSSVEFHIDRRAALRSGGIDPDDPGPALGTTG